MLTSGSVRTLGWAWYVLLCRTVVQLPVHEDLQVHVQLPGCLCLLGDLDGDPLACILDSPATAVQLVIVSGPKIEPQAIVPGQ